MLEEADDTKVLLTILRHGAPINCLHLGHTRLQLSGWLKETMKES